MVSRFVSEHKLPISEIRLERYRPDKGTDLEMVVNYFWNIELSKALYPGSCPYSSVNASGGSG